MSLEQGRRIFIPEHESVKEQDIKREIEVFRKDHVQKFGTEKDWRKKYLNNFYLLLDDPFDPNSLTNRRMLDLMSQLKGEDLWEKPFGEDQLYRSDNGGRYSELFLSKTPRQFYKDVDDACSAHGITPEVVYETKKSSQEKMNEILMPAYIELRKKGYSRYKDLTT